MTNHWLPSHPFIRPPIKSQGIKFRLLGWLEESVPYPLKGRWVEPFLGTGVVALNLAPAGALLADSNPHVIAFYKGLADGSLTGIRVRAYLETSGRQLSRQGKNFYLTVRARFNRNHDPLDFLFLNRSCFNGLMRFNRSGGFNVPFCQKPDRFAPAYITMIVHQVEAAARIVQERRFQFRCQDFRQTLAEIKPSDFVYCDPPYLGRNADYYNGWSEKDEADLSSGLKAAKVRFAVSSWHHNDFRQNTALDSFWRGTRILTREHFYHVGASTENRHGMTEALILSPSGARQR